MRYDDRDRLREVEREVHALRAEISRMPVRQRAQRLVAGQNTLITAKPENPVTGAGDFSATVVSVDQGEETETTVTVVNRYGETLATTDEFPAWKRESDGKYLPDRTNGTGAVIYRFALNAALALEDDAAAATESAGSSTIQVVDPHHQFAAKSGAHGFALKFTDDYLGTGNPGAYLITLETPMRFIAVKLYGSYSLSGTNCEWLEPSVDAHGHPFEGWPPPVDGSNRLDVWDTYNLAGGAAVNDEWWAIYNEDADQYDFFAPMRPSTKQTLRITGTVGATVDKTSTSVTLGSLTISDGTLPTGVSLPTNITATIDPNAKMDMPSGTTGVFAVLYNYDGGTIPTTGWRASDTGNSKWVLRGYEGWASNKLLSSRGGVPEWITVWEAFEMLTGWNAATDQGIYGDAGEHPQWKDDNDC